MAATSERTFISCALAIAHDALGVPGAEPIHTAFRVAAHINNNLRLQRAEEFVANVQGLSVCMRQPPKADCGHCLSRHIRLCCGSYVVLGWAEKLLESGN